MTPAGLPSIPTPARQHTLGKLSARCKQRFTSHRWPTERPLSALPYLGVANKAKEEGCADKGRQMCVGMVAKQEVKRGKGLVGETERQRCPSSVYWTILLGFFFFWKRQRQLFAYWKMLLVWKYLQKIDSMKNEDIMNTIKLHKKYTY